MVLHIQAPKTEIPILKIPEKNLYCFRITIIKTEISIYHIENTHEDSVPNTNKKNQNTNSDII